MTANSTTTDGWKNKTGEMNEEEKVPLASLSELTGFPVEFIKKELLLDGEELSLEDLRKSMVTYLKSTNEEINEINS